MLRRRLLTAAVAAPALTLGERAVAVRHSHHSRHHSDAHQEAACRQLGPCHREAVVVKPRHASSILGRVARRP